MRLKQKYNFIQNFQLAIFACIGTLALVFSLVPVFALAASCSNANDCGNGQICQYPDAVCAKCQSDADCTDTTVGYGAGYVCNTATGACQQSGASGNKLPCNQGRVLCVGASGPDVLKLQQALNAALAGQGIHITENSTYDSDTQNAVAVYQNSVGITADGMAGPETLGKLGITLSGQSPAAGAGAGGGGAGGGAGAGTGGGAGNGAGGSSSGVGVTCNPPLVNVNGVCLPNNPFASNSVAGSGDLMSLISLILKWLLFISGIIAVIMLIIGGYWYMTAGGNEEQAEKGRKAIVNSIIGLIVVILAFAIVTVVTNLLTGSQGGVGGGLGAGSVNQSTQRPGVDNSSGQGDNSNPVLFGR